MQSANEPNYKQLINRIYASEIREVDTIVSDLLLLQFNQSYQHNLEKLNDLIMKGKAILKDGIFSKFMSDSYLIKKYQGYLENIREGVTSLNLLRLQSLDRIHEVDALLLRLKNANLNLDSKISIESDVRREIVGQFFDVEKMKAEQFLTETLINARKLHLLQEQAIRSTGLSLESYKLIVESIDSFSFVLIPSLELRISLKQQQQIMASNKTRPKGELEEKTSFVLNEEHIVKALGNMEFNFKKLNENIQQVQSLVVKV